MIALLDRPGTPLAELEVDGLQRLPSVESVLSGGRPDVVVIGPGDPDPVRTTQQVGTLDVPVIICATPAKVPDLKHALRFAPQTPSDVTIIGFDDPGRLATELRKAAERSQKRQRHSAEIEAANRLLSGVVHPAGSVTLDRLLEIAPVGILSTDEHGAVQSWNQQAEQQFSGLLTPGVAVQELFDARCRDALDRLVRSTEPSEPFRVTTRNGEAHFDVR